jgi:hypothetical protein
MAKIELRIPFQQAIRFLPETDYPRASRSFSRIAGSGNEIAQTDTNSLQSSPPSVIWRSCWPKRRLLKLPNYGKREKTSYVMSREQIFATIRNASRCRANQI